MNNFTLIGCDTDAVFFCLPDGSPLSKNQRADLVSAINTISPEFMTWDFDGYYPNFIVLKTKNYITRDETGKVTLKGSSLKSATLEPILKQFLREIIDSMLDEKNDYVAIYEKYIKMTKNIVDMKPWSSKKTISDKTLNGEGTVQVKIRETIENAEYVEGDKIYLYVKKTWQEDALDKHGKKKKVDKSEYELLENFNGIYDQDTLIGKLFECTKRFWTVLDKNMFINYTLVRNKSALEKLLNENML